MREGFFLPFFVQLSGWWYHLLRMGVENDEFYIYICIHIYVFFFLSKIICQHGPWGLDLVPSGIQQDFTAYPF